MKVPDLDRMIADEEESLKAWRQVGAKKIVKLTFHQLNVLKARDFQAESTSPGFISGSSGELVYTTEDGEETFIPLNDIVFEFRE